MPRLSCVSGPIVFIVNVTLACPSVLLGQAERSLKLPLLADPFEVGNITHWFYFA
jgi:hypothetical protein